MNVPPVHDENMIKATMRFIILVLEVGSCVAYDCCNLGNISNSLVMQKQNVQTVESVKNCFHSVDFF